MTKKELVALLNTNFSDSEEVFVKYSDPEGDPEVSPIAPSIESISETHTTSHTEILIDGKWSTPLILSVHPSKLGLLPHEYRKVIDSQYTETKKCLVLK